MTRRAAWLLVALVWLLMYAGASRASTISPTGGMGLSYGTNSLTMTDGPAFERFIGRILTADTVGGGASVAERYGVTAAGNTIEVAATRAIPASSIAAAVAAAGVAGAVGFSIGGAVQHFLGEDTSFSVGSARCTSVATGWKCDEGGEPTPSTVYQYYGGPFLNSVNTNYYSNPASVASSDNYNATNCCGTWTGTYAAYGATAVTGNWDNITCQAQYGCVLVRRDGAVSNFYPITRIEQNANTCPAVIDGLNPAWSKPAGGSPGPDGKCPTGRYDPKTAAEVAQKLAQTGATNPQFKTDAIEELLTRGQPITVPGGRTLTGPGTKVGSPSSTTTPEGTTTRTPTTNYYYDGDTITYNITYVTVNPDGTTTTETPGEDPADPCAKSPDTAGCSKLGTPPTDKPTWTTKDIPFTPESVSLGSGCPVPWTHDLRGWHLSMSFTPLCDTAPIIKPGILALTSLCSLIFIFKATKS